MKAAIISLGSKSSQMTFEAMKKYFTTVDAIDLRDVEVNLGSGKLDVLYKGEPLKEYDCIYAKGSFRYAPLLRSITRALYDKTYMPIKSDTFTIGHDKLLTHLALQLYKIPMPKSYLASSREGAVRILDKVNYPIVMKFPQGTQGKGVMFADSYASATSLLDALQTLHQPFLIQEYVETGGEDIRMFIIGDKVAASMKRKAVLGEKRSNIHTGAKGEPVELDYHTKKIAVNTAKSIGADICAVDILESSTGPLVIEANLSPGLRGISEAINVDIADKIARFLHRKAAERKEKGTKHGTKELMTDLGIHTDKSTPQQIIANLDIRGNRILLPEVISKITGFGENDECVIKVKKGKLVVEKV